MLPKQDKTINASMHSATEFEEGLGQYLFLPISLDAGYSQEKGLDPGQGASF